jgi:dienelactone hydrolase
MRYYLALPAEGSPRASRPILVLCSPRGAEVSMESAYASADRESQFLIVAPVIVGNSGKQDPSGVGYGPDVVDFVARQGKGRFDEEGILAIVRELQAEYGAQSRFLIAGFSAGGHATWLMVFLHPDLLAGAVSNAGNFLGRGLEDRTLSQSPERATLPLREIIGSDDGHYAALYAQWQAARKLATDNGWGNLSEETIPGEKHTPRPDRVLAFFSSLLARPPAGH